MRYKVLEDFDIDFNNLLNLKGSPEYVGEHFLCSYNDDFESLEGAPKFVGVGITLKLNGRNFSIEEIKSYIEVGPDARITNKVGMYR